MWGRWLAVTLTLRDQDIHKIVDAFARLAEFPKFSRMVPLAEISDPKNDFNLNLPRYIDSTEPEDLQDIDAHLRGGIPIRDIDDLAKYWDVFPDVRKALFKKGERAGYCQLRVPAADIKAAIFGHAEFTTFNESVTALFAKWRKTSTPKLKAIAVGGKPKALIETIAEDLLNTFREGPEGLRPSAPTRGSGTAQAVRSSAATLVDPYDVYQHLMTYWSETMQDDVYMIVGDGWQEAAKPRQIVPEKDGKTKEKADFTLGKQKFKAELIPPALVVARYFQAEQAALESLEAEAAALAQKLEELKEEHSGEEGLFAEVLGDKGGHRQGRRDGAAEGDQIGRRRRGRTQAADRIPRPDRAGIDGQQAGEGGSEGIGSAGRGAVRHADRGRDQDVGRGRQVVGATGRRCAERTGSSLAVADRPRPATRRALCVPAAEPDRAGRVPVCPRE